MSLFPLSDLPYHPAFCSFRAAKEGMLGRLPITSWFGWGRKAHAGGDGDSFSGRGEQGAVSKVGRGPGPSLTALDLGRL